MKKYLFTAITLLLVPLFLNAQADKIKGTWLTEKGTSSVEVTKGSDGFYNGKVNWLEEPNEDGGPKIDKENEDPELAKRPILGLNMLTGLTYDSKKDRWINGSIYDPDNGKTYDCYAWFKDGNYDVLYLKGYVAGIKALGRKTEWKAKK